MIDYTINPFGYGQRKSINKRIKEQMVIAALTT
jgi:hypothetical protein